MVGPRGLGASPCAGRNFGRWLAAGAVALTLGALSNSPALAETAPGDTAPPAAVAPVPPPTPPFTGNAELKGRLDADGPLVVAGERMHKDLLRRFYEAREYKTVWDARSREVAALSKAVLAAAEHGLDPALFHGAVIERAGGLPPVERDLLLSDAFLSYADALARGAMPPEARYDDETLTPGAVDAVAALDAAIKAPDPAQALTALAPASPEYRVLQRAYAEARGAAVSGAAVPPRAARKRPALPNAQRRIEELAVALERLRWLPRAMPADRVVVNTAIQMLELYRGDRPLFTTRVVVGQPDWQTPEFQSTIDSVLFNPPWNVPPSILRKEILPKLAADPGYLAEHHMRYRGPNRLQQEAGPHSALGRLKFEIPDPFDVYLHDTPEKQLFARASRTLSHGCIRVQNPQALAALVLDTGAPEIAKAIGVGTTHRRQLSTPLPIFIVYQTVLVGPDGTIRYAGDPYDRDHEVWNYLNRAGQVPLAQDSAAAQRKG